MGGKRQRTKWISSEEFIKSTIPCKNSRNCKVENCPYLHNIKTRLCKFINNCHRKNNCPFAHSTKELTAIYCKFGNNCKNDKCTFKHPENIFTDTCENKKLNNQNDLKLDQFPITIKNQKNKTKVDVDYSTNIFKKDVETEKIDIDSAEFSGTVDEMVNSYEKLGKWVNITFNF